MATNHDRAERWIDRALGRAERDLGHDGNVFYNGDRIYSYGYHFEMARVMRDKRDQPSWILVNGDRFSVTTAGHQSMMRGVISRSGLDSMIVPYSALNGAGIDVDSITPIEVRPDRSETTEHESETKPGTDHGTMPDPSWRLETYSCWDYRHGRPKQVARFRRARVADPNSVRVGRGTYGPMARRGADGIWRWKTTRHILGDSLFSARVNGQRGRRKFLSSFDEQETTPLYFLCELPPRADVWSVEQAFQALKPEMVVAAESAGLEITRQGDVFAIPTTLTTLEVRAQTPRGKGRIVKRPAVLGTNHEPTAAMFGTRDRVYARGTLYHAPGRMRAPDHARRKLGDGRTWHLLIRNTVPRSRPVIQTTR